MAPTTCSVPNGYMSTGFLQRPSGEWVYADSEGALVGGWVSDGGSWYYMDPDTKVMRTGWLLDRGSWYYLSDSGAMDVGWVQVDGSWYYMNATASCRPAG